MKDSSARRRRVFMFFAVLAAAGAVIKWLAPPGSDLARLGAMLLIIWIPVASYFIFYLAKKRRFIVAGPRAFANEGAFRPELEAEVAFNWPLRNDGRHPIPGREYPCILALGTDGFSARFVVPAHAPNAGGAPQRIAIEFLAPEIALPRFLPGTRFRVLEGNDVRGEGRVIEYARN